MANKYPTIFLHGFMGFGDGDWIDKFILSYWGFCPAFKRKDLLMPYLKKQGYEVYYPHLGPWNSAWDRACILYAYLVGGTVDYGKAHAEKYGHERYGRTYPGVLKDWGQKGDHEKINIIGHSFGGPLVIAFSNLLRDGCEEERACTPKGELSPLFEGGHGDLLHTVTTFSGVNNGTTMASILCEGGRLKPLTNVICKGIGMIGRMKFVYKFWDQHLDQFGLSLSDKEAKKAGWRYIATKEEYTPGADAYSSNHGDNVAWEMTLEWCKDVAKHHKPIDSAYYFAYRSESSKPILFGRKHIPVSGMNPVCYFAGFVTGLFWTRDMAKVYPNTKRKDWLANDGFVNVIGQNAPFNAPQKDAVPGEKYVPGMWYNMPVEHRDHLSWAGSGVPKDEYFAYIKNMLDTFAELK